jgi:hypothetical protein
MARFYFYVVVSGQQWAVKQEGQSQGLLYGTQSAAIEAAASAARTMNQNTGRATGVRIQGSNGQWRDERSYGDDPFPPRG